ncbi:MAG: hypothetical protein CBB67_004570 [Alteromonadaceae bacterium TMED7]|nr:hypothetical protein [Alteromonadaceae bacterium]RPH20981.1 MAG: hypothetical protein CBB67_004570 [Alteromonadaceae bacterium TMED7]|tara:strand:+ start:5323 stop:7293 length:1971 start_codon:yes stop_codon:yes gene_type:complete
MSRLNIQYQQRDLDFNDYNMNGFQLKSGDYVYFRDLNPNLLQSDNKISKSFSIIGPAFSLGCHTNDTFGHLLSEETGLNCLNFSLQGSSASTYLMPEFEEIINNINKTKFCIVCVFSGRSVANSEFRHTDELFTFEKLVKRGTNTLRPAHKLYEEFLNENGQDAFNELVNETVDNYHASIEELYSRIQVPIVTLWFSKRLPAKFDINTEGSIFKKMGMFPHFLGEDSAKFLKNKSDYYVEAVGANGTPQLLFDRWDGYVSTVSKSSDYGYTESNYNLYYASPMMHFNAFKKLSKELKSILPNDSEVHFKDPQVTVKELTNLYDELYLAKFLSLNKGLKVFVDDYFFNSMHRSYENSGIDYAPFWPLSSSKVKVPSDFDFAMTNREQFNADNNSDVWAYLLSKSKKFHEYKVERKIADKSIAEDEFLKYAIVTTPRSGSTMLSSILTNVNLGKPKEHLRSSSATLFNNSQLFDIDIRKCIDKLEYYGSTAHSGIRVFGTKLIAHFIQDIEESLISLLKDRSYKIIYLEREDEAAQVTSILRARKTNLWHLRSESDKKAVKLEPLELINETSEKEINEVRNNLNSQKFYLDAQFKEFDLSYMKVSYEDLTSNKANEVCSSIVKYLGAGDYNFDSFKSDTLKIGRDDDYYNYVKAVLES